LTRSAAGVGSPARKGQHLLTLQVSAVTFQVLSLSGGGFFGLYTVSVLEELERQIGVPIGSCFDLIAGTSVGGIIALAVAHEIPATEVKAAFEAHGPKIFSNRPAPRSRAEAWADLYRSLFKPKYKREPLRQTIVDIIGEGTLLGHLKHPCIVPAVNLTKGGPQVFKTDHHPSFKRDLHLKAVDVALATSSAPGYFPIAEVGDELFADGGLYANSPDLLALHEAEHFFRVPASDVRVLSIGTTTTRFSFSHEAGVNFGLLDWASRQRLVRAMISSQQLVVDYMLKHKLADRYLRLDIQQSREQEEGLALDVATLAAQRTIRGLAEATIREAVNQPALNQILGHRAAAPVFHNRHTLKP
jgi:uncharacterized protein